MNCFNVDLEIGFNFEFGNTQRTLVECEFCLAYLSQETTLVRAECVRQRNEVAIKLGIIFLSLSPAVCSKP